MSDRLGGDDRETLSKGLARWELRVDVARRKLVRRGLLAADPAYGIWELTEAGIEELGRLGLSELAMSQV